MGGDGKIFFNPNYSTYNPTRVLIKSNARRKRKHDEICSEPKLQPGQIRVTFSVFINSLPSEKFDWFVRMLNSFQTSRKVGLCRDICRLIRHPGSNDVIGCEFTCKWYWKTKSIGFSISTHYGDDASGDNNVDEIEFDPYSGNEFNKCLGVIDLEGTKAYRLLLNLYQETLVVRQSVSTIFPLWTLICLYAYEFKTAISNTGWSCKDDSDIRVNHLLVIS